MGANFQRELQISSEIQFPKILEIRPHFEYYKGVPGEYTSYVFTDHLSGEALVSQRDWLEAHVRAKLGIPYNVGAPGTPL